jgi:hypothetical protein
MAEPAIGGDNLIGFDNTNSGNQNTDLPSGRPFPATIPTSDTNVNTVLSPTSESPILQLLRDSLDENISTNEVEEYVARSINPIKPIELQNQYVPESNYKSVNKISGKDNFFKETEQINKNRIVQNGDIELSGNYSVNKQYFPKFDLSSIIIKDNIAIKFILKVVNGKENKLFTSKLFYEYLEDSYNRNVPFAALSKLPKIVTIDMVPIIDNVKKYSSKEIIDGVRMNMNVCIRINRDDDDNVSYSVDYDKLLNYVDWITTKPSPDYEKRILPSQQISEYILDDVYDGD